ncbi:MAG TPA: GNAT family protein [Acidimicrobiales bacterium]
MDSTRSLEIGWIEHPTSIELEGAAGLVSAFLAEVIPGERPYPAAELAAELAHHRSDVEVRLALAVEDGVPVGMARLTHGPDSDRRYASLDELVVAPDHRRRGVGRRLLDLAAAASRLDGRTVLAGAGPVGHPGSGGLAERVGARAGLIEHQNRTVVAGIDRSLLEAWVVRAAERADGYSLVAFDGRCPDDLVDGFAKLTGVMNTAPHTDAWEMPTVTAQMVHEGEEAFRQKGGVGWTVCVRHDGSGQLVAYTELGFLPYRPWLAEQGDTAVDPLHRDKGLGRWIKATNALRLLDERPEVEVIETWNASVNAPMLSINDAMGFRPVVSWQDWELALD